MFKVKIQGEKGVLAMFDNITNAGEILDNILDESANEIEQNAKSYVDANAVTTSGKELSIGGEIKSNFFIEKQPMHKEVGVRPFSFEGGETKSWAAFMEYGTGRSVLIPEGLQDYAYTFYVNGRGTIMPAPFLFPAFERQRQETLEAIKKALK